MPSLLEILNDPNYTGANQATKEAIFNKYAPLDENYSSANSATQEAIRQRFGVARPTPAPAAPVTQPPAPEGETSVLRSIADVPLAFGKGLAGGIRAVADAFGAGSDTSQTIKGVEDYIGRLMSAQSQNDAQEMSRIMKEAEDKGALDQVKAAVKAFSIAPIDTVVGALGTSAPVILSGLAATLAAPAAVPAAVAAGAATLGAGAILGAGTIKGAIYDATKEELGKYNLTPQQVENAAQLAQEYGGQNLDQILIGAGLGAVGGRLGIEQGLARALAKAMSTKPAVKEAAEQAARKVAEKTATRRIAGAAVGEGVPELLQGAQEQLAENLALQRQGFDVPTLRGVVGAGVFEGLAGSALGAATALRKPRVAQTAEDKALADIDEFALAQEEAPAPKAKKPRAKKVAEPAAPEEAPDAIDLAFAEDSPVAGVPKVEYDAIVSAAEQAAGRTLTPEEAALEVRKVKVADELYSVLNREPTPEEIQEKLNGDLQPGADAGAGVVPGVGVAGVSDTGIEAPGTVTPGVTEPAAGGVGVPSGVAAESGEGAGPQLGALDEAGRAGTPETGTVEYYREKYKTASKEELSDIVLFSFESPESIQAATDELAARKKQSAAPTSRPLDEAELNRHRERASGLSDESLLRAAEDALGLETPESIQAAKDELAKRGAFAPASDFDPVEFAIASAATAFDQRGAYDSLQDSIDNYFDNLRDTMQEKGVTDQYAIRDAEAAFNDEVLRLNKEATAKAAPETAPEAATTDPLYLQAAELAQEGVTDVRELAEALRIGYNRAARIREELQRDGVIPSEPGPREAPRRPKPSMEDVLRAADSTGLPLDIVEAIQNNDVNGVLRILGQRLGGFYGDLANRLAAIGLTTRVEFDGDARMSRDTLDRVVGPSEGRLFAYVQRAMPKLYDTFFKNYDRVENLAAVKEGLKRLASMRSKLGPVIAEFDAVTEAYNKYVSLDAPGVFFPNYNTASFNTKARGGLSTRVLLHELVHAATEYLIIQAEQNPEALTPEQREAYAQIKELFGYAQTKLDPSLYGMSNLSEFVAEAFTSRSFQSELRKLQMPTKRESVLRGFVRSVLKFFGYDNVATNTMLAAEKLFSPNVTVQQYEAGPRFAKKKGPVNRGPIKGNWRTAEDAQASVNKLMLDMARGKVKWEEAKERLAAPLWNTTKGALRAVTLPNLNLRQLSDLTKTKFPQIASAINIVDKMISYRASLLNRAENIIKVWNKAQIANPKQNQLMSRIMLEATISQIEVDPNGQGYNAANVPPALKKAWDTLSPTFQQIYRDVRDFYRIRLQEMRKEMLDRARLIEDEDQRQQAIKKINEMFNTITGPYFPLRRFGKYWFQVGKGQNKEFYEFESRAARDLAFAKRRIELRRSTAKDRALLDTLRKGNGITDLYRYNTDTKVLQDVQGLVKQISSTAGTKEDLQKEIEESLNQLIYVMLPQQSMRKMFINRKSVQGASSDMLRVFATSAIHGAYQQARYKYAQEFITNLDNAREFIDGENGIVKVSPDRAEVYRDYIMEVEKRVPKILSNEDTSMLAQVAAKASDITFFFQLSAPFTALLNVIGFTHLTVPYIGGRYGYADTTKVVTKNFGRYFGTTPKRTFRPLKDGRVVDMEFPSIVEGADLSPIERAAADKFIADQQINISLTNDIFNLGERPTDTYTGTYNNIKRILGSLFHQSERLNREVTLMTVFELAYQKYLKEPVKDLRGIILRDDNGDPIYRKETDKLPTGQKYSKEAFDLAVNEAKEIAGLSLGEFTRQMKPRTFMHPGLAVILKYKQYAITALYATFRNFYLAVGAPFSKSEIAELRQQLIDSKMPKAEVEQKVAEAEAQRKQLNREARRTLAGILGTTFLFGGLEAQPFFWMANGLATLAAMLAADDDDEDPEYFDFHNWFRNYMEKEFGGFMGTAIGRGPVPAITGGATTERISLDPTNLLYRDGRYSPDIRENIVESIIANAGPVVGLGFNWIDAYKFVEEGKYQRAFELAAPALFAKPVTAARLAEEGAVTRGGVKLVDEFTGWELAMQSLGLQPERLAQAQKANIEYNKYNLKLKARRDALMNRLYLEYKEMQKSGNREVFDEFYEELQKFSRKYPEYSMTNEEIRQSFEKRNKDAAKAEAFGARVPKGGEAKAMEMLYYGRQ